MLIMRTIVPKKTLKAKLCDIENGHPPHRIDPTKVDSDWCMGKKSTSENWPAVTMQKSNDPDIRDEELLARAAHGGKRMTELYGREVEGGERVQLLIFSTEL